MCVRECIPCVCGALTGELVVDELSKAGVVAPPEETELAASGAVVTPPHAQHVGRQTAAEAAQDGVLLRHREQDGGRGGPLPHESPPFNPSQVSLRKRRSERGGGEEGGTRGRVGRRGGEGNKG